MKTAVLILMAFGFLVRGASAQIYAAAERGNWAQVKELLQAQPKLINKPNEGHTGETLLHIACENGPVDMVGYLIENGANVNAADKYGITPLLNAVDAQTKAIVSLLLDKGADVNMANTYGVAPLHLATKGCPAIVDILLAGGAKIDKTTSPLHGVPEEELPEQFAGGDTPLLLAVKAENSSVAEHLINKGADVRIGDKKGQTPLHIAVRNGRSELVVLLLKHKANVNAKTSAGSTALDIALEEGDDKLVDYLRKNGAREGSPSRGDDESPNKSGIVRDELAAERSQSNILNEKFGRRQHTATYKGSFVGSLVRRGMTYRKFQFYGMMQDNTTGTIEILLPPDNVTTLAVLSESSGRGSESEPAHLVLMDATGVLISPDGDPVSYFRTNYPDIPNNVPISNILVLSIDARNSLLWCPKQALPSDWRGNQVQIDYKSLQRKN